MQAHLTRRTLLRGLGICAAGLLAAACEPKVVEKIVKETVQVEKVVKEVVKETVIVAGTPQVVEKTVEKVVTAAPAPAQIKKIIYSTWAGGDAEVNLKQQSVKNFNDTRGKQLGIECSARITTDYPAYWTKLPTSFAGGDAPDAVWSYVTDYVVWIESGWVRDITPYVDIEPQVSAVRQAVESQWAFCTYLNKVYAIPHLIQLYGVQYNVEMFQKEGIPVPPANWDDPSWTIAKYNEIAIALTKRKKDGTAEQLGGTFPGAILSGATYAFMEGNGGRLFDDSFTKFLGDQDPAVEVAQWSYDLFNKYKICPTPEEGSAGFSFWNGKCATMISLITWPARLLESSKGMWTPELAPLPKWNDKAKTTEWSHAIPIMCSMQSKYPEAVIEFGRWMVEFGDDMNVGLGYCAPLLPKHAKLLMTEAPGMPDITARLQKMRKEPHLQALKYNMKTNPYFAGWKELNRDIWTPKVHDVLYGGKETDYKKIVTAAKPAIEKLLADNVKRVIDFQAKQKK